MSRIENCSQKIPVSSYCSAPHGWPLNYTTTLCELRRKQDQAFYVMGLIFVNFPWF